MGHARTPVPDLIGDDPGIHQSSGESLRRRWVTAPSPVTTAGPKTARKIPAFPCHFAALGLERRHVRSPRTPGGLLRWSTGRDAAFKFLANKDLSRSRPS